MHLGNAADNWTRPTKNVELDSDPYWLTVCSFTYNQDTDKQKNT